MNAPDTSWLDLSDRSEPDTSWLDLSDRSQEAAGPGTGRHRFLTVPGPGHRSFMPARAGQHRGGPTQPRPRIAGLAGPDLRIGHRWGPRGRDRATSGDELRAAYVLLHVQGAHPAGNTGVVRIRGHPAPAGRPAAGHRGLAPARIVCRPVPGGRGRRPKLDSVD